MATQDPLVSIIMNCHNGEKYLNEAICSVLSQTYENWELIFWDNQSTDKSSVIVQKYKDSRIQYFYAETYTRLGEARNHAIKKSQGEFIAFLDCDDLWMSTKLEKQIPLFSDTRVGLVICDTYFFNEKKIIKQIYKKKKPPTGDVFRQLLGEYFVSLETAVLRRLALNSLDNWFDPRFNMIEEYDLFVRLGHQWHLAYLDEVLAKWRIHDNSWTWQRSELFSYEKKIMLETLNIRINNFQKLYSNEIILINIGIVLSDAKLEIRKNKSTEARRIIKKYLFHDYKCFLIYCLTFLPYKIQKLFFEMKGIY